MSFDLYIIFVAHSHTDAKLYYTSTGHQEKRSWPRHRLQKDQQPSCQERSRSPG